MTWIDIPLNSDAEYICYASRKEDDVPEAVVEVVNVKCKYNTVDAVVKKVRVCCKYSIVTQCVLFAYIVKHFISHKSYWSPAFCVSRSYDCPHSHCL